MPGINSLPSGAETLAGVVLTYSAVGWMCSAVMIWLTWVHRQRTSYVAMIAYFTILGTTMSIIQQANDITLFAEIITEQWEVVSSFPDSPELAIANGSFGLDLVLFYFQFYTYNAEALCVFFWAGELVQTLYGVDVKPKWKRFFRKINQAGRGVAIILPLFTTLILRLGEVRSNIVTFLLVADLPLMLSLTCGSLLVISILIRYLQTQKKFTQWSQPKSTQQSGTDRDTETGLGNQSTVSSRKIGVQKIRSRQGGIYDRWLMVRFFFSFIMLGVFNATTVLFQLTALKDNKKDTVLSAPDLSLERAQSLLLSFLPGVTPGIILFLVFGTTAGHRKRMYETFVPKKWQRPAGSRSALSGAIESWRSRSNTNSTRTARTRKWPWAEPRAGQQSPSYAMSYRTPNTPTTPFSPARRHRDWGKSVDVMTMMTKETMADLQKPLPPFPSHLMERDSLDVPPTIHSSQPPSIGEARVEQVVWRSSLQDPSSMPVHVQHQRRSSLYELGREPSNESSDSGPILLIMSDEEMKRRSYRMYDRHGGR